MATKPRTGRRLTVYFREEEYEAVAKESGRLHTSDAYIIRLAVRRLLGLDKGRGTTT